MAEVPGRSGKRHITAEPKLPVKTMKYARPPAPTADIAFTGNRFPHHRTTGSPPLAPRARPVTRPERIPARPVKRTPVPPPSTPARIAGPAPLVPAGHYARIPLRGPFAGPPEGRLPPLRTHAHPVRPAAPGAASRPVRRPDGTSTALRPGPRRTDGDRTPPAAHPALPGAARNQEHTTGRPSGPAAHASLLPARHPTHQLPTTHSAAPRTPPPRPPRPRPPPAPPPPAAPTPPPPTATSAAHPPPALSHAAQQSGITSISDQQVPRRPGTFNGEAASHVADQWGTGRVGRCRGCGVCPRIDGR